MAQFPKLINNSVRQIESKKPNNLNKLIHLDDIYQYSLNNNSIEPYQIKITLHNIISIQSGQDKQTENEKNIESLFQLISHFYLTSKFIFLLSSLISLLEIL